MILIHGGAGHVAPERHDRLRAGVRVAAAAGHAILGAGGSAVDAVQLSPTMPVAWADAPGIGDSLGDPIA